VPLTSGAGKLLAAHRASGPLPRLTPDDTLRVARTVGDLYDIETIGVTAMCVALGFRGEDDGEEAG
jgi:hypothetical protein